MSSLRLFWSFHSLFCSVLFSPLPLSSIDGVLQVNLSVYRVSVCLSVSLSVSLSVCSMSLCASVFPLVCLSCLVLSYLVLSCLVLSCLALSCLVCLAVLSVWLGCLSCLSVGLSVCLYVCMYVCMYVVCMYVCCLHISPANSIFDQYHISVSHLILTLTPNTGKTFLALQPLGKAENRVFNHRRVLPLTRRFGQQLSFVVFCFGIRSQSFLVFALMLVLGLV